MINQADTKEMVVGIRSIGTYIPEGVRNSEYISKHSGIPEEVIRKKFGIKQVRRAKPDETVSGMGAMAAKDALGDIDPLSIDLVVYCGSEYKDYYLFNCAAKIQDLIGAKNAISFEIHSLCSAGVYSLSIIKSMMLADKSLNRAIIVSSSKEGDLINYSDIESRFMFNFGDGASAVLLEKNYRRNIILQSHMISDGRFANDVMVKGVGCVNFANFDEMDSKDKYLCVRDLKSMKEKLDPITFDNFVQVIHKALEKSGYDFYDVGYLAPIFMKRSMLVNLLEKFELTEENTFLLEDYGHCQSADCYISLKEGERLGRLKDGNLVVLVSAGTGYTWSSTVIKWGDV